jgi:hypothetical protein
MRVDGAAELVVTVHADRPYESSLRTPLKSLELYHGHGVLRNAAGYGRLPHAIGRAARQLERTLELARFHVPPPPTVAGQCSRRCVAVGWFWRQPW